MTPTAPEILIGDFTVCFMPLNSYLLGNYAISLHYSHYSFYLIEEILLHNYWENELLFHPNFHPNFSAFLNQKKPNTYLITSGVLNSLRIRLITYPRIIGNGPAARKESPYMERKIPFIIVDYNDAETRISDCLKKFSPAQKSNFHFLLGIPPVVGSEEKLARIVDFLHTQSSEITNLSIILLQNSYKSAKHLTCLPNRIFRLPNQCFYQFPNAKFARLRVKRSLATLEEILVRQRKGLQEDGLLIIFFLASWQEEKLELKKLRLELIGISSQVNLPKLENKIKTW
ncbi:5417_t:CDS:2, partial [Racocetra persica]